MSEQKIISVDCGYAGLDQYFQDCQVNSLFLVCDSSIDKIPIGDYFDNLEQRKGIKVIRFSAFTPNPLYESVIEGVQCFRNRNCDMIAAVGGGSAMDVAKCIKLYSEMDSSVNYLRQKIVPNDIKLLAVPTTAGTGSEATRYAVIYYEGEKQSVTEDSCIPSAVLLDGSVLKTLPEYQRKSTMLDAFCHALESYWSINSTENSLQYSNKALNMILESKDDYLANKSDGNAKMLLAAHLAGKAINITQTTAGHAMCYKLTSLYGIAHGHAAALCVSKLWEYMVQHTEKCIDPRGVDYLKQVFAELAVVMGSRNATMAVQEFERIFNSLHLLNPVPKSNRDFDVLKNSVNLMRLKNNPVELDNDVIDQIYHEILVR